MRMGMPEGQLLREGKGGAQRDQLGFNWDSIG
eukprot:COSAG06_NODE_47743_length_337_cov_0.655462_1_plen_31_part_10